MTMQSKLLKRRAGDEDRQSRIDTVDEEWRLPNLPAILPLDRLTPLLRNLPDRVTIYRAVPPGVDTIRPGDWVALEKRYAALHGRGNVISKTVPAADVVWAGTDMNEFFYIPR